MKNILIISIGLSLIFSSCSKKGFSFYCNNKIGIEVTNQVEIEKAIVNSSIRKNEKYYDNFFQYILIQKNGESSITARSVYKKKIEENSLTDLVEKLWSEGEIDIQDDDLLLPIIFLKAKEGTLGIEEPNWTKYKKMIKSVKSKNPSIVISKPICIIQYPKHID